jgi:hypothetical protein
MCEYMSAEAAASSEPGAQSGPLVFKYNPDNKTVNIRRGGLRPAEVDKKGIKIDKWETVIYNKYIDLRKKWKNYVDAIEKFELSELKNPQKLDNITYQWRAGHNESGKPVKEKVRIHRFIHPQASQDDPHVIIMQPSWQNWERGKPDTWDDINATLYIVDDPRFLDLDERDNTLNKVIMQAGLFWNGISGLSKYRESIKQEYNKSNMSKPQYSSHKGGRHTRRTRRTRRTRK